MGRNVNTLRKHKNGKKNGVSLGKNG